MASIKPNWENSLKKSFYIDNPFSAYVQENADVEQLGSDYRRYLREITKDMFSTLTQ